MTEELFNTLVWSWIGLAVIVFVINIKIIAPYGRHASKKWGPLINNKLAWVIMESPVLILVLYFVITNFEQANAVVWFLVFLFTAHYFHRTFIFPLRIRGKKKKMPLGVVLLAITFNLFNGTFIGYYLGHMSSYDLNWFYSPIFILGLLLFATGAFINWRSDDMLFNLRKDGSSEYRIPQGFLFNRVSCPNHFGEIIEWSGYALMSFNIAALAFAVWTAANLIPRALAHHNWYLSYFNNYPTNRKAIFPGIL
jgi:3-oxo-5-alpha-steroid 4-dehydrogenase 1